MIATAERLEALLGQIGRLRVAVVGDYCLDAYWSADMTRSELSRETPHHPLPIVAERYAPGAAGNVAMNAAALGAARVSVFTVMGEDWRAQQLAGELEAGGLDLSHTLKAPDWVTPAYIKPIRQGYASEQEDARLDFGNYAALPTEAETALIRTVKEYLEDYDAWLVCDQLDFGVITSRVQAALLGMARGRRAPVFVADARKRIGDYAGMAVKPNELELAAALGRAAAPGRQSTKEMAGLGLELAARLGSHVFVTLGERGALVCGDGEWQAVPAAPVSPPVDTVGAGDSFLAAMGSALGAGSSAVEAAALGNLAASVTVKKLQQTGTASPAELRAAFGTGLFTAEDAEDRRGA